MRVFAVGSSDLPQAVRRQKAEARSQK